MNLDRTLEMPERTSLKNPCLKRILTFLFVSLILIPFASAQMAPKISMLNLGNKGNQLFPAWSANGQYLAYQSDQNGNWDIYVYNLNTHQIKRVTSSLSNDEHPVWIDDKDALAFDSNRTKGWHLYYKNLKTGKEKLLFHKNIQAREASFSPSGRLVAFSGYDQTTDHWQIFTYDLVFNNLNLITKEQGDVSYPEFSPNGRFLAYHVHDYNNRDLIKLTNWFGDFCKILHQGRGKVSWSPDSWRLFFVPGNHGHESIASVGHDGTSFLLILNANTLVTNPAISPDGKKIAYAKKTPGGWKIVIENLSL
jgi:Tol biopolymer transport system component